MESGSDNSLMLRVCSGDLDQLGVLFERHKTDCETAERRMLQDERLRMVEEALFRLSEEQREILVLSRYRGLKYREIGQILGCSVGAAKVRVFRAIMNLKQVYAELEG